MHPMERLRFVAQAAGVDPAVVVAETAEAIAHLHPDPAELVTVCRQLVQRNPACGPLWWLSAHLLRDGIEHLWDLADLVAADPTSELLADALPDDATVVTIGWPEIAARALVRRGDVAVLGIDAGVGATGLVRMLDRADSRVEAVDPAGLAVAAAAADLALVEVGVLGADSAVGALGTATLAAAARTGGTPVWPPAPASSFRSDGCGGTARAGRSGGSSDRGTSRAGRWLARGPVPRCSRRRACRGSGGGSAP